MNTKKNAIRALAVAALIFGSVSFANAGEYVIGYNWVNRVPTCTWEWFPTVAFQGHWVKVCR
jgi:hypothetical protein